MWYIRLPIRCRSIPRQALDSLPRKKVTSVESSWPGIRRVRPWNTDAGDLPVVAWMEFLYCRRKVSITWESSSSVVGELAAMAALRDFTKFSANPLEQGCLGAVKIDSNPPSVATFAARRR